MSLTDFVVPSWAKALLLCAAIGGVLYKVDQHGYAAGEAAAYATEAKSRASLVKGYEDRIQALLAEKIADRDAALRDQQAVLDQANRVGTALLEERAKLTAMQKTLRKEIPHVAQTDGARWTGLGPASLRLYAAYLGYSGYSGLPATHPGDAAKADQATGTDSGIPPADLLAHAADYGEWCQKLESQVDAFITLYGGSHE